MVILVVEGLASNDTNTERALDSDEIKDALPASPLEQTSPAGFFPDGQVSAPSSYESSLGPASDSPVVPPAGYGHSQVSPLTPPEQYDSRGYLRDGIPTPRPILARPPMTDYAPQGTMSFNFGDGLPQLWNMDGAPASPPPLPDLDRKSTRLNSSHSGESRMPSSA